MNVLFRNVKELVASKQLIVDKELLANLDLNQTLDTVKPKAKSYAELKEAYAEVDVPSHRFAYGDALKLASQPFTSKTIAKLKAKEDLKILLPGPELAKILDNLELVIGDTSYEELTCAGYNPETRIMSGVISVKRSYGYSGDLCSPGSTEYVGFWVHYDGSWHAMGQAEVQVHDLPGVDSDNTVEYAVFRAVNMLEMPCEDLTGLPLRAILSWNDPPAGPVDHPHWGNVINTHIQPNIGEEIVPEDENRLRLLRVGRVTINGIDNVTGLATNPAPLYVSGDCHGNQSPFAGNIFIEGDFVHKIDVFNHITGDVIPGTHPLLYQVFVHKVGSLAPPTQLTNSFTIAVTPQNAMLPITKTQSSQPVGVEQYYTYMESSAQVVNPRTLAVWQAGGLDEGLYTIEAMGFSWNGMAYVQISSQVQNAYVFNGYPHIELVSGGGTVNARRPEVHLQITSPGGDCGDFVVGDTIEGNYSVTDHFFGRLRVRVVPITVGGVPQPVNTISIEDSTVPQPNPVEFEDTVQADTNGMSGTWSLNTARSCARCSNSAA